MDKTIKYQHAILELFKEYDKFWGHSGGLQNRIIADTQQNTFAMIAFGWQNEESYTHLLCFHIEIINGKVWVHENNTEAMIVNELIEKGIAEEDIILGFIESEAPMYQHLAAA
jgi:XisI protein